jgi:hypothetical protein
MESLGEGEREEAVVAPPGEDDRARELTQAIRGRERVHRVDAGDHLLGVAADARVGRPRRDIGADQRLGQALVYDAPVGERVVRQNYGRR